MPGCRSTYHRVSQGLEARGLLGETLVIWGGEFGRTGTARVN